LPARVPKQSSWRVDLGRTARQIQHFADERFILATASPWIRSAKPRRSDTQLLSEWLGVSVLRWAAYPGLILRCDSPSHSSLYPARTADGAADCSRQLCRWSMPLSGWFECAL